MNETTRACEPVSFVSGGYLLKGFLHLPDAYHAPVIIGSHGLFSSGASEKQIALAKTCNANGMGFLRFDHRGIGESEGDFNRVTTLEGRSEDILAAIDMIAGRKDTGDRFGLFGSSFGGAVALAVASRISPDALVTVAAPVRISAAEAVKAIDRTGESDIPDKTFFRQKLDFDISDRISKIRNILIFHGDQDEIIPVSNAHMIYENAGEPKKLIIQNGGDHRISHTPHQEVFVRETTAWFLGKLFP